MRPQHSVNLLDRDQAAPVELQRPGFDHIVDRPGADAEHFGGLLLVDMRRPRVALRIQLDRALCNLDLAHFTPHAFFVVSTMRCAASAIYCCSPAF
jgi:hypothetical protein